jgi:hypothetical protein
MFYFDLVNSDPNNMPCVGKIMVGNLCSFLPH